MDRAWHEVADMLAAALRNEDGSEPDCPRHVLAMDAAPDDDCLACARRAAYNVWRVASSV